jgi:hypothetical protein
MKILFSILLVAVLLPTITTAQNCKNILLLQKGKRITTTLYDKKGKEEGKEIWRVNNVNDNGVTAASSVKCEVKDKDGIVTSSVLNNITCNGVAMQMNLKMMLTEGQLKPLTNAKVTTQGEYMDYPVTVTIGDKLTEGHLIVDVTTEKGINKSINLDVTDRVVGAKESITTTAGTWECYKITSKHKIITKVAGIGVPTKTDVTEWYAPGVGIIKTETKNGTKIVTAIQ